MKLPARRTDPGTSHEGTTDSHTLARTYDRILDILGRSGPLCDEQIRTRYTIRFGNISPSGCRTRRSELVMARKVQPVPGIFATTPSGRRSIMWEVAA